MGIQSQWTGHEARQLRTALRLSVRAFAAHLGIAERTVSKWEKAGRDITPWPDNQALLDTCLAQAPDDAQARFAQLVDESAQHRTTSISDKKRADRGVSPASWPPADSAGVRSGVATLWTGEPDDAPVDQSLQTASHLRLPAKEKPRLAAAEPAESQPSILASNGVLESPADIAARRADLQVSNLTGELVADLEQFLANLPDRYETAGPLVLAPEVVDARRLVHRLLSGNQRLKQRATLFELAGRLSGQLSYMAVNLGNFSAAQAYGAEAFELARFIEHDELAAWIRGTQSFAAYYTGDYERSLVLAQDGQRYAKGGIQAVRLAINGEARALGKLDDRHGTANAVAQAYRLLEKFPSAAGMTPCISFGVYSEARTASNAATAYLALGQTKQVLSYAERIQEIVDAAPSQWSYALIRLDMAMALLSAEQPEPEGASALGAEAINAVRYMLIESIQQRTRELMIALRPWRHLPTVAEFVDDASSWLATGSGGNAAH